MKTISVLTALLALATLSTDAWAVDSDGDGHHSIATGGDDCDDGNHRRYPGNAEACDAVDNDCDPSTIGVRDQDRDGFTSFTCCNVQSFRFVCTLTGCTSIPVYKCGNDCDDTNPSLVPNAQRCEAGTDRVELCGSPSSPTDDGWYAVDCEGAMSCAEQPNGTGVCR